MAIVVVGGTGKNVGKTALVCAVIAALPEFSWTAVKITGHDYKPEHPGSAHGARQIVWEETAAGHETDTGRFLAAGARRALLVRRYGQDVPVDEIQRALGRDRDVIFESNRIVDAIKSDVVLALAGGEASEQKPSFRGLLHVADAVVSVGDEVADASAGIRRFRLQSADHLTPELAGWLRERLGTPGGQPQKMSS